MFEQTTLSHVIGQDFDPIAYKQFLYEIGYLVDQGDDFKVVVQNVDPEIAEIAGPQLVVPLNNARFALNAANARWGSLFDCLYSSDVIPEGDGLQQVLPTKPSYNPKRGAAVISQSVKFLDSTCPLTNGSYGDIISVQLKESSNGIDIEFELASTYPLRTATLTNRSCFAGYGGDIFPNGGKHRFLVLFQNVLSGRNSFSPVLHPT